MVFDSPSMTPAAVVYSDFLLIHAMSSAAVFYSFFRLSSDPRYRGKRPNPPCGVTESLEILFLMCFVCDVVIKVFLDHYNA